MSDGMMIILIFAGIILLPLAAVFLVLSISRASRRRKLVKYTGQTQGQIERISHRGIDGPWVIAARYTVDGQTYRIKETAKLRSQTGGITRLTVCGRMINRIVCHGVKPSVLAASCCPRSIDWIPAR